MDRERAATALDATLADLDRIVDGVRRDSAEYRDEETSESGKLSQHPAEYGSDVQNVMEQNLSLEEAQVDREEVLAAQQRLADGTYGICVDCGREIGEERLQARPQAARCIEDQERADRRARR